jgi:O-antigen/teichoic acid export membrane protein
MMSLFNRLDLLFVKGLSGSPQDAGYYGAVQNITMVPALFMAVLVPALLSKLAGLRTQGQIEPAKAILQRTIRMTFCLLPFGGLTAGTAVDIVVAIYGQAFLPAGRILAVLVFAALGLCVMAVSTSALVAVGRPRLSLYLTVPIVGSAFWGHCIFVPACGTIGAAGVTTALSWLGAGASMLAVYRYWEVRLPALTVLRSMTICLVAFILAAGWKAPGLLLLVKLPAISIVIVISTLLLGEFTAEEIFFMRSMSRAERGGD